MFEEYLHIMSDPAHMAAEVTFMILIDVILLGMALPLFKRAIRKHDKEVHGK